MSSWLVSIFFFITICIANSLSIPKSNRVTVRPFSDEVHFENDDEHNAEYDHDAFLGEEEADEFDDLTPEESKEKLAILFDKIDTDGDGLISEDEMQTWIRKIQNQDASKDADKKWDEINPKQENSMTWEEYEFFSYGTRESIDSNPDEKLHELIKKDQKRWRAADFDQDSLLSRSEFSAFMFPESVKEMEDVVAEETLEEIDANKDGLVDLQEFIGEKLFQWLLGYANDMDIENSEDEDTEESNAEWIESEKQNFIENLDKNKDGKMDREEVKSWLMSEEWNQVNEETDHLFKEADEDMDKHLSKSEMLNKFDLFVGSQATDYGDLFNRHDDYDDFNVGFDGRGGGGSRGGYRSSGGPNHQQPQQHRPIPDDGPFTAYVGNLPPGIVQGDVELMFKNLSLFIDKYLRVDVAEGRRSDQGNRGRGGAQGGRGGYDGSRGRGGPGGRGGGPGPRNDGSSFYGGDGSYGGNRQNREGGGYNRSGRGGGYQPQPQQQQNQDRYHQSQQQQQNRRGGGPGGGYGRNESGWSGGGRRNDYNNRARKDSENKGPIESTLRELSPESEKNASIFGTGKPRDETLHPDEQKTSPHVSESKD
ncbi:hypothetical protein HELRODRAFT_175621 [Helobdella robusta]|uniref:Reticulocalbin-3 n=1 Tax=Helobdella robusta TaxID=6412 RepID=T1F9F8_HELRO|nr:hypothetical protein HELRODRAFT_175621 [Helobdella robusta]ESO00643.1 hypothetical protein HELRODRAFT_175621 [Helobdella robusta]